MPTRPKAVGWSRQLYSGPDAFAAVDAPGSVLNVLAANLLLLVGLLLAAILIRTCRRKSGGPCHSVQGIQQLLHEVRSLGTKVQTLPPPTNTSSERSGSPAGDGTFESASSESWKKSRTCALSETTLQDAAELSDRCSVSEASLETSEACRVSTNWMVDDGHAADAYAGVDAPTATAGQVEAPAHWAAKASSTAAVKTKTAAYRTLSMRTRAVKTKAYRRLSVPLAAAGAHLQRIPAHTASATTLMTKNASRAVFWTARQVGGIQSRSAGSSPAKQVPSQMVPSQMVPSQMVPSLVPAQMVPSQMVPAEDNVVIPNSVFAQPSAMPSRYNSSHWAVLKMSLKMVMSFVRVSQTKVIDQTLADVPPSLLKDFKARVLVDLGETSELRNTALIAFRAEISNVASDKRTEDGAALEQWQHERDTTLIRFLRLHGFNAPAALQALRSYLHISRYLEQMPATVGGRFHGDLLTSVHHGSFVEMDIDHLAVQAVTSFGIVTALPERALDGSCVVLLTLSNQILKAFAEHTVGAFVMAVIRVVELLSQDPLSQLNGMTVVIDMRPFSASLLGCFSRPDMLYMLKQVIKFLAGSHIVRYRAILLLGVPFIAQPIVAFGIQLVPPTLKRCIHTVNNVTALSARIGASILPQSCGGHISSMPPLRSCIDTMRQQTCRVRLT